MKTVVVIGGGITGLSTVYYLQKQAREHQLEMNLVLIEANEALGGKINTVHQGDFYMEVGADSIVARKPNMAPLLEELNLQDQVVYNATGTSFIYTEGELKKIPEDAVFGIPLSIESLATSELISAEGKVEALKDLYTPLDTFTKDDSIGLFLEACLGREIVEKQIAPVLSGVYSGQLNELTIASTLPYLLDYKKEYGSIIRGLSENRQKFKSASNKKFLSFNQGMNVLIETMENQLQDVDIRKGVQVQQIVKDQEQYKIAMSDDSTLIADFVVMTTPNAVTHELLQAKELEEDFNQLQNSSMISVYLAFDVHDSVLPQDGTGFIVADSSDLQCNACTWTSRKWEHTSKEHRLLVRLFYKSSNPAFATMQQMTEEEMMQEALKDIELSLGITEKPVAYEVTKWMNSMPYYHINHHQIVKSLEQKLAERYPRVILAGCSYYGVGIPDCISNGERTAEIIVEQMEAGMQK